jgi:hypothetical protein
LLLLLLLYLHVTQPQFGAGIVAKIEEEEEAGCLALTPLVVQDAGGWKILPYYRYICLRIRSLVPLWEEGRELELGF